MTAEATLLNLTHALLDSITAGDWTTYAKLCDPRLTCFEPEANGHLVEGMPFHQFYFDLGASRGPKNITLAAPQVRIMGDAALVTYTRLIQQLDGNGQPVTLAYNETRVWHNQNGEWKHVHFHRSSPSGG